MNQSTTPTPLELFDHEQSGGSVAAPWLTEGGTEDLPHSAGYLYLDGQTTPW